MKKILFVVLLCTSLSLPAFSFFEFSGSAGVGFYFGKETVGMENTIMEHSAVGAVANFYATTPINLGLWLRFAYQVPYYYSLQDLTNPEYSTVADLTYIFTQFLDFSIGVTYIIKFNDYFALPIAAGFNFIQNILSPRISYTYGATADVAIRAAIARTITISLGVTGTFGFSMDFISQGLQYKTDYSLLSATPYISLGFVGKPPTKNPPVYEGPRYSSFDYDDEGFDDDHSSGVFGSDVESILRIMLIKKMREKIGNIPTGDGSSGKVLDSMPVVTPGGTVVTNDSNKSSQSPANKVVTPSPVPEAPTENVISDLTKARIAQFNEIFAKDNIENVEMTEINGNFVIYLKDFKFLPKAGLTVAEIKRIKALADCLRPLRNAKVRVISHINMDTSVEAQMLESVARAQEIEKKLIAFYALDKKRIISGASNVIPNKELGNCIEIVITKGTF